MRSVKSHDLHGLISTEVLPDWGKAATAHIVGAQSSLIGPVDQRFLALGLTGNSWVDLSQPTRDRLLVSLIRAFDRTLNRQTPAFQIAAHCRQRQTHPVFPLDQQLHRRTRPQIEGQFQLLGHFAYHQCTDTLRLFDAELARLARAPAVNPVALFGNANGDRRRQEYHCRISSSDGSGDAVLKEVNHAVINNWDAGT